MYFTYECCIIHYYFIDVGGNPVTQSVVSVTDSSGNPVTGNIDTDKTFINDFKICKNFRYTKF